MTDFLSPAKRDQLRRRLDDLPELAALAEVLHNTRLPKAATTGGSRPHPGSRPPINLALVDLTDTRQKRPAVDKLVAEPLRVHNERLQPNEEAALARELGETARRGVLPTLENWVRMAESEMLDDGEEHTPLADDPTVSTEAGWLHQHLGWIVGRQWVDELERDVARMWRDLRQACSERPEYKPRCPECRATLTALVGYWACSACGRDYRDERMVMSCQQPMTGERIAELFGINHSTITTWKNRGHLDPAVGDDGKPLMDGRRPKFHITDVLRLADASGLTN